jgi:hypothetical protein
LWFFCKIFKKINFKGHIDIVWQKGYHIWQSVFQELPNEYTYTRISWDARPLCPPRVKHTVPKIFAFKNLIVRASRLLSSVPDTGRTLPWTVRTSSHERAVQWVAVALLQLPGFFGSIGEVLPDLETVHLCKCCVVCKFVYFEFLFAVFWEVEFNSCEILGFGNFRMKIFLNFGSRNFWKLKIWLLWNFRTREIFEN